MVERFLEICCLQQNAIFAGDAIAMAMLFLFSYIFLLRVPSEALPAQAHQGGHSVLCIENGRLIITHLAAKARRTCVGCGSDLITCVA